jgi:predicted transcriptional regulator
MGVAMAGDRAAAHKQFDATQKWDAHFVQVRGDLLHHLSELSRLLARHTESTALSPDMMSEMALVKSLIDIYEARSADDLEDFKTGFSDLDLS